MVGPIRQVPPSPSTDMHGEVSIAAPHLPAPLIQYLFSTAKPSPDTAVWVKAHHSTVVANEAAPSSQTHQSCRQ